MAENITLNQKDLEDLMNIKVRSSEKGDVGLGTMAESGPIVLNFIVGTWCPQCVDHLMAITAALKNNNLKIIVISNESQIRLDNEFNKYSKWSKLENIPLTLHSDASKKLINIFKLKVPVFGFSKPATFLIHNKETVQVLSTGIPNTEKTICDLSFYAKGKTF